MPSKLQITPLKPGFAAQVRLDAASASPADIAALKECMMRYSVLVLPRQKLDYEDQVRFASSFGPIDEVADLKTKGKGAAESTRFDRLEDEADTDPVKKMLATLGTTVWHTDGTYKATPAHLSMLFGITVAKEGGQTQFADLRAAYRDLPEKWKKMAEGLVAEHSTYHAAVAVVGAEDLTDENMQFFTQRNAFDIVRTLPESGEKTLYLSAHASRILGLPVPQGRMILRELTERATLPDNTYTHEWNEGDLVIWDNRCTLHRLRPYRTSERRVLQRVSTADVSYRARDPGEQVTIAPEVLEEL